MLEPNRDWDQRYVEYLVQRKDGRLLSGLLAEENGNALVLVKQDGQRVSIPRSDIEQLRNHGRSFMPEGFEKVMTPAEAASLLDFLLQDAPRPKSLPGNQPRLVEPSPKGVLTLPAASAEIYGQSITLEAPFSNIGYWHGEQDMARWRVRSEQSSRYEVYAIWACDNASAGNVFRIDGFQTSMTGAVAGTGGWSNYQRGLLGEAYLEQGEQAIVVRPNGPLKGALWDLKLLELRPIDP